MHENFGEQQRMCFVQLNKEQSVWKHLCDEWYICMIKKQKPKCAYLWDIAVCCHDNMVNGAGVRQDIGGTYSVIKFGPPF